MPLFDYECTRCGAMFETLVRPGSAEPACVACGATDLRRIISSFAVDSESTRASALANGRKHAAKERRDRAMAEHEHEISHRH